MSSSSCVSEENSYRRRLNAERGTPKQCWCGEPSEIFTSGAPQIQEEWTIAAQKDIIRFVLVRILHVL